MSAEAGVLCGVFQTAGEVPAEAGVLCGVFQTAGQVLLHGGVWPDGVGRPGVQGDLPQRAHDGLRHRRHHQTLGRAEKGVCTPSAPVVVAVVMILVEMVCVEGRGGHADSDACMLQAYNVRGWRAYIT